MTSGTVTVGIGEKFRRFLRNIELTDSQKEDAQRKHQGVRKALHDSYYVGAYTGSTSILAGSYGKNTAVRPPTDVDILFIMPESDFQRYDSYVGNGQSQLLQDVKNRLVKKYPTTRMRGDGQVVVVDFTGSFGVEVVPVFHYYGTVYRTPDAHDGGSWKTTNPAEEKKLISESNTTTKGNTVHLIKMMKVWKYVCSVPIKSLTIEQMAVGFLSSWQHSGESHIYYDWMVRDFFAYMLTRKNSYEWIPGITELNSFGSAWASKAESAYGRAKKACEYGNDYPALARAEWKKIFGDFWVG